MKRQRQPYEHRRQRVGALYAQKRVCINQQIFYRPSLLFTGLVCGNVNLVGAYNYWPFGVDFSNHLLSPALKCSCLQCFENPGLKQVWRLHRHKSTKKTVPQRSEPFPTRKQSAHEWWVTHSGPLDRRVLPLGPSIALFIKESLFSSCSRAVFIPKLFTVYDEMRHPITVYLHINHWWEGKSSVPDACRAADTLLPEKLFTRPNFFLITNDYKNSVVDGIVRSKCI